MGKLKGDVVTHVRLTFMEAMFFLLSKYLKLLYVQTGAGVVKDKMNTKPAKWTD